MPHPLHARRALHALHTLHTLRRLCAAITFALGTALLAPPGAAASLTWNGQFGSPQWSATVFGLSNWNGGLVPQNGDTLSFAGNAGLLNNNDYVGLSIAGLSFAAGAGAFTLAGLADTAAHRLVLTGNLGNLSGNRQTINLLIDARGAVPQLWDGGAQGVVINRSVTLGDLTTVTLANQVTLNDVNVFTVGTHGDSTLNVTAGSVVGSGQGGVIGERLGSNGTVTVAGTNSRWATGSSSLLVGAAGYATLNIESGGRVTSGYGDLGYHQTGNGTARVSGANSQWIMSRDLAVGRGGRGLLTIADGGLVSNQNGRIGFDPTGHGGSVTVTGANARWINSGDLSVGNALNGGTLRIDSGGFVSNNNGFVGPSGAGSVTVTDAGSLWISAGTLHVGGAGAGTVVIQNGATAAAGALVIGDTGVLNLDGGTLQIHDAALEGAGQFNWSAGTLRFTAAGATLGAGTFQLDSATTLPSRKALEFSHSFAVGSGNQLLLAGGTLGGTGSLLNDGTLAGFGALAGSGGFTNSGLLVQSGGNLALSNTGANANTGNWDLAAGFQLQLAGATLANHGALNLSGASVSGTGTLVNAAGGTVSGRGSITAGFSNAGALVVDAGTTLVGQAFANSGQIQLSSNTATLAGGLVSNSGQIEGRGRVSNAVDNTGTLEAVGGTLSFAGALANTGSGVIAAGSGAKVWVASGLARNDGQIQLAGGTFDNNGVALLNAATGTVSGFGALRSGAVRNEGRLLLAGGTTAVHADLRSTANSQVILSGQGNTSFYGTVDIQGGAELRVSQGAVATFFGLVNQRSGAQFTGTGAKYYEGGLAVGNSPGLGSDAGSVSFGAGNTYTAEIAGTDAGDALGHGIQFDRYVVAGALTFGGTLEVVALEGFAPQAGQSFDLFDWGSSQGSFEVLNFTQAPLAGGLAWDTSRLYLDGTLSVTTVPEPSGAMMLLAGLGFLGFLARRRRP